MTNTYISLLKGINVGGHHKIKMAELRDALSKAGLEEVRTYIQSGNIVYQAIEQEPDKLSERIHALIAEQWGYDIRVFSCSFSALRQIQAQMPFEDIDTLDPARVHVCMLTAVPTPDAYELLEARKKSSERLHLIGPSLYLHTPDGYGRSKLTNSDVERICKCQATTRNWKTINKLVEMCGEGL